MTPSQLPSPKNLGKNIVIALAIIAVIIVALVVGVMMALSANQSTNTPTPTPAPTATPNSTSTFSPTVVPYDFKVSAKYPSFDITQGASFYVSISIETISGNVQSVSTSDVEFSADSGSSEILSEFNTTHLLYSSINNPTDTNGISNPTGFSNVLLITVPESTPTSNYTITVTAKIGSVSHSVSIIVGVESSTVTLSGKINLADTGVTLYQIRFYRFTNFDNLFYANIESNTYSISIPNHEKYVVSVSDGTSEWLNCDTDFWLQVPAGSNSMTQDFTVFG